MNEAGLNTFLELTAPITYIGLLVFCLVLTLITPEQSKLSLRSIDASTYNLRIWGYAAGIIIFLILLIVHQMKIIEVSPIDFIGGRILVGALIGFIIGVGILEGARLTNLSIFSALFIAFVVAGSLSSLYVFILFESIRAILVLATMFFLLGLILDFIIRNGLKSMLEREFTIEDKNNNWD